MGANKKKKTAATVGAVALAAALVLTGTYAWNSISQKAKNENTVYANPGGRLHDDWNGSDPKKGIKRVYVENFTKETYTDAKDGTVQNDPNAAAIYVRVKLQTYMEYGEEAGKVDAQGIPVSGRNAKPLVTGSDMGDTDTWPVYIYGQSSAFQSYFDLKTQLNEKLKYMPTFNKNKESLLADINGTYEGTVVGDTTYFNDFKDYGTATTPGADGTASQTNPAYYYLKDGTSPANTTPGDETKHVKNANETHAVSETLATEKIITMEEWLTYDGSSGKEKTGNYWIYDEDGWAYWAAPLEKGEATGPLLTDVKMKNSLGGNCYYAINVTGEFASAGDWGKEDGENDKELGFYKNGITDNALTLLNTLANTSSADWINITATSEGGTVDAAKNTITVDPGSTVTLSGNVTLMGDTVANQNITWGLEGAARATAVTASNLVTNADGSAKLTIPSDADPQTITVSATSAANSSVKVLYKIKIAGPHSVRLSTEDSIDNVLQEETVTLVVRVLNAAGSEYSNDAITWEVEGNTSNDTTVVDGRLTIASDETPGGKLKVIATSQVDTTKSASLEVTVYPIAKAELVAMNALRVTTDGTTESEDGNGILVKGSDGPMNSLLGTTDNTVEVTIDGVTFYVLAKQDGKALLLSKYRMDERPFFAQDAYTDGNEDIRNRWKNSTIRAYLNGTDATNWLAGKPHLAELAVETILTTLQEFDDDVTDPVKINTTQDKIFLLSEADVFGSTGNTAEANVPASFYTVTKTDSESGITTGVKLVSPTDTWIPEMLPGVSASTADSQWWWLRSPKRDNRSIAHCGQRGVGVAATYGNLGGGVRPACWIELKEIED